MGHLLVLTPANTHGQYSEFSVNYTSSVAAIVRNSTKVGLADAHIFVEGVPRGEPIFIAASSGTNTIVRGDNFKLGLLGRTLNGKPGKNIEFEVLLSTPGTIAVWLYRSDFSPIDISQLKSAVNQYIILRFT